MFVVLYRWQIKPRFEQQFVEAWSERTAYLLETYDSLGSRLHRGSDGIWYGYAQWKSPEQREQAFQSESGTNSEAGRKMQEAIEKSFPEIKLEIISDYAVFSEKN